jgi:hypothetical protein
VDAVASGLVGEVGPVFDQESHLPFLSDRPQRRDGRTLLVLAGSARAQQHASDGRGIESAAQDFRLEPGLDHEIDLAAHGLALMVRFG